MTISSTKLITRQDLYEALLKNTGLIVLKFGAEWCQPCKKIESFVHQYMSNMPPKATCIMVDIDESTDLYAFLKSKRIVNGVPAFLAYDTGNVSYAPDVSHIGSDKGQIHLFFEKCKNLCQ
jgi:thiol-disulfide isomerase/thioredoxin